MRRGGTVVLRCTEPGCREDAIRDWSTRLERSQIERDSRGWKCLKHAHPDEWLRPEQPRLETVLVATRLAGLPNHLFWVKGDSTTGNGFAYGPGFRAFAEDVPEGTVLRVTATLELPLAPPSPQDGRCESIGPAPDRFRCGLPKGHDGTHSALIPTGAPWFAAPPSPQEPTKEPYDSRSEARENE